MDSPTSHQLEIVPDETPPLVDSDLAVKAQAVGAYYMLPSHDLDSPLSPDEILPRFGEPVIHNGINCTALAHEYLDATSDNPGPLQVKQQPGSSLRELANVEAKSTMEFNARLLRDHDSLAHRKAGVLRFEKYVTRETGKTFSRSTLLRRMVHAKFVLIFAAGGAIDILPTQNQANLIGQLPRPVWLPFWRELLAQHPTGEVGKSTLEDAVPLYAAHHHLPLRGKRLDGKPKARTLSEPKPDSQPEQNPGNPASKEATNNRDLTRQEADQEIVKLLDPILQKYLPRRVRERSKKNRTSLGRQYLTAIRAAVRRTPSPAKGAKRSDIFNAIVAHHPTLGQDVLNLMLALAFERFDKNFT